jgi:signal transduction histidine kinase
MVHEDRTGILWVGTWGDGLERYDPSTNSWTAFEHDPDDPTSLSHNTVEAIIEDSSGAIWAATGRGLNRLDEESGTFTRYTVADGLANDRINGLLEDDFGDLWLATDAGLSRYHPDSEIIENYNTRDGVQGPNFWRNSYYKSEEGELFFGGANGINAFFPENIIANPQVPPVVITRVSLFNEPLREDLPPGEQLIFNYDENFLSFDFVALDYTDPEQNQYAYQMVGLDPEWVQVGNRRHADYPNLQPGEYTFRVIGSNNDGVWNEVDASVSITIQPPFWETPWFISLVITALIGAGYGAYRYRVRSLKERSLRLENEVVERTTELQSANTQLEQEIAERERVEGELTEKAAEAAVAEERNRLARDLHDAVTQTLFSTSLIAEVLPRLWSRNPEEGERRLNELRELSRGALAEMRTLLLELRPAGIAEAPIADLLQHLVESTRGRSRLPVHLEIEGEGVLPPQVKVTFYRIAQEALNNVSKHANADQVLVNLAFNEDIVALRVEDDGLGFDVDDVTADHFGLGIMRERAQSIGAEFRVLSEPGEGTKVVLTWHGENR